MSRTSTEHSESRATIATAASSSQPADWSERNEHDDHAHSLSWAEIARVVFVAAAASGIWFLGNESRPLITAVGAICTLVGGFPIFHEAYENITQRRMTMELSMTIAIVAALAIREVFTALVITLFVLVAEILEGLTVSRGRRAIEQLIHLLPKAATVRRDGAWKQCAIEEITAGDEVLVRPGGLIPVDGLVVGGQSFVDQAAITGESMPAEKRAGSHVFAGTMNQSGALEICVERLGRDTSFGKIVEAVERAEQSRAPIQRLADRLAGYLVYFALGAAALTFLVTHNMRSTISVVIVAGACGIAAGTPLAILGGIGRAAQHGAIVKGGRYLEKLAEIDTVVLDKTGTLTYGTPEVLDVCPTEGITKSSLLEAAAIAESRSEHPVGRAILKKAADFRATFPEPERFEYFPGKGVAVIQDSVEILVGTRTFLSELGVDWRGADNSGANGDICVARQKRFYGTLRVADQIRPEAGQAISALKTMKFKTVLLTGDSKAVADDIGKKLGVDEIVSELLPDEKSRYVMQLTQSGRKVAMVGDGVNDAPALVQATVGVAMGSGTDVARESADVVLIGNDLSKLVETLRVARRCHHTIMQNFVGTLVVDSIGVGLAAVGLLNPLLAAFIHVSSEMVFILNSARLLPPISTREILGHRLALRSAAGEMN